MANTVLDYLRAEADQVLTIPDQLGMRPYTITMTTVSWDGGRPGLGNKTSTSVVLTNGPSDGYCNPRYRQVSQQDISLSGGQLRDQDVVIGPIVFPYDIGTSTGGTNPLSLSTFSVVGASVELYFNIQGPNFPPGGNNFKRIYDTTDKNILWKVYARNVGST